MKYEVRHHGRTAPRSITCTYLGIPFKLKEDDEWVIGAGEKVRLLKGGLDWIRRGGRTRKRRERCGQFVFWRGLFRRWPLKRLELVGTGDNFNCLSSGEKEFSQSTSL
jgi:hypothetical protein